MLQGQFQSLLCQLLVLEPPTMRFSEGCQRCLAHSPMQLSATDISTLLHVCHRLQHSVRPRGATFPPLFLAQTKASGAKKNVLVTVPPLISGSGLPPPPPPALPEGLDPTLQHIHLHVIAIICCHWKKNNNNNYKEKSKIGINLPRIFLRYVIFDNLWQKSKLLQFIILQIYLSWEMVNCPKIVGVFCFIFSSDQICECGVSA